MSAYPGEARVWRNGALALHPVHHVKVAHLVLVCHSDVRRSEILTIML